MLLFFMTLSPRLKPDSTLNREVLPSGHLLIMRHIWVYNHKSSCEYNVPLMSTYMLKSRLFSPNPSLPDIGNARPILIHTRLTPSHILDSLYAAPRRTVLDPRLTIPILGARSLTQRMRAAAVGVVFAVWVWRATRQAHDAWGWVRRVTRAVRRRVRHAVVDGGVVGCGEKAHECGVWGGCWVEWVYFV